eukprot:g5943.t1
MGGFFDTLDDEVDVAFLNRVKNVQKELNNLADGESVIPLQSSHLIRDHIRGKGLEKDPAEDDEVEFFKEFALDDLDEISQTPGLKPNTSSKTKTNSGLPSIDAELDLSDLTDISSKKKDVHQTPTIYETNNAAKEVEAEVQVRYLAKELGSIYTIEEEPGKEEVAPVNEQKDNNQEEKEVEVDSADKTVKNVDPEPTTTPEVEQLTVQGTENQIQQDKGKTNLGTQVDNLPQKTTSINNKKYLNNISFHFRVCFICRKSNGAKLLSPLMKLSLLAPKKGQELFPLKRPIASTKSQKSFFAKTLTVSGAQNQTQIQNTNTVSKHNTSLAAQSRLGRDKSPSLLPRKKQKQSSEAQEQSGCAVDTKEQPNFTGDPSTLAQNTPVEKEAQNLNSSEIAVSVEEPIDLTNNQEGSPDPVPSTHSLAEVAADPDLESPDFNSTTKELEFVIHL